MTNENAISLTAEEEALRQTLHCGCEHLRELFKDMARNDTRSVIQNLAPNAHQLHMLLKKRGETPVYQRYFLANRGYSPDTVKFYEHFHAIERLLRFINDRHANDDPIDKTIGHTFTLHVYTNRWEHPDLYQFEKTGEGWNFSHLSYQGQCSPNGCPYFYDSLKHDSVGYPSSVKFRLEEIWHHANDDGWNVEQVQESFDMLGFWLEQTEKSLFNPNLPQEPRNMVGCIAMFDVLGWKEMQARKENALEEYLAFVVLLKRWLLSFIHDGQGFVARVDLNIVSDTLFLYAPCEHRNMYRCLNHFATIASKIISDGIQHGFFMRGAISFGQFQLNLGSAVFIGDALDDVAAQYENANWIGCHLSPNLSHVGMGPYGLRNSWVQYNGCPLKIAPLAENNFICISDGVPEEERVPITNHIFVVDFMQGMQDEQKQQIKNALSKEQQSHSDCQRVAEKYKNTLEFINHYSE